MMLQSFDNIVGHKAIVSQLNLSLKRNMLSHSYIFYGQKGIGKFSLACQFANILLGINDSPHQDLMILSASQNSSENKSITVSEVRKIESFLRLTCANNKWRIAIIDEAENMTYAASNALLKILEEPGDNTVILLITHSIASIIPTLRSRCINLKFNALSQDEMLHVVMRNIPSISYEIASRLLELTNNIGMIISIYNESALDIVNHIENCIIKGNLMYIDDIIKFADTNTGWEIVKSTILRCIYKLMKISVSIMNRMKNFNDLAKKIDLILSCDSSNLDKARVIAFCLS